MTTTDATLGNDPAVPLSWTMSGPLLRLERRLRVAPPKRLPRLVVSVIALTWVVPAALMALEVFRRGAITDPLAYELGFHMRFLVSVPLFLVAEAMFSMRVGGLTSSFFERGLLQPAHTERWNRALARARRLTDTAFAELIIVLVVVAITILDALNMLPPSALRWLAQAVPDGGMSADATPARWWYVVVSQPVMLFLVGRWLWRWGVWGYLLFALASIPPVLNTKHPDRAGGLAALTITLDAFQLMMFGAGLAVAATWRDEIVATGIKAAVLAPDFLGFIGIAMGLALAPFAVFTPVLVKSRYRDTRAYAVFAGRYIRDFDAKWLPSAGAGPFPSPALPRSPMGSSDIQSLADLGNSYTVMTETRATVVSVKMMARLFGLFVLPTIALVMSGLPAAEIAKRLIEIVL